MDKHGHTGERDKYRKKKREKVYVKKKNSMNPYLCFHQFLKKKKKVYIYIYIYVSTSINRPTFFFFIHWVF